MMQRFLISLGLISLTYASSWRVFTGVYGVYANESLNPQTVNLPAVDAYGNVSYLTATTSNAIPVILGEYQQAQIMGNSGARLQYFAGLQGMINESWRVRLKMTHLSSNQTLLASRTLIYTPQSLNMDGSSHIPQGTLTCPSGSSSCAYASVMPNTEENVVITDQAHRALVGSILYRFSERFFIGPAFSSNSHAYELRLNKNPVTNFTPKSHSYGFEAMYAFSPRLALLASTTFFKDSTYIKRLVNFQVAQSTVTNSDGSTSTSYALSYIPVENSTAPAWQACSGYLISGEPCSNSQSLTATVTNYYYNATTPANYGTTMNVQTIDPTLGPQAWWKRFGIMASIGIEWNTDPADWLQIHQRKHF